MVKLRRLDQRNSSFFDVALGRKIAPVFLARLQPSCFQPTSPPLVQVPCLPRITAPV
jgi:hypothetical protein